MSRSKSGAVLLALSLVAIGCTSPVVPNIVDGGQDIEDPDVDDFDWGTGLHALELMQPEVTPFAVAGVVAPEILLSHPVEQLQAGFGEHFIVLHANAPGALSFVVPDVAPGTYRLVTRIDGERYETQVEVLAGAEIPNPLEVVSAAHSSLVGRLDQQLAVAEAAELARLQALRAAVEAEFTRLRDGAPAELQSVARFLAANPSVLETQFEADGPIASGSGAQKLWSGQTCHQQYGNPEDAAPCIRFRVKLRIAAMLITAAALSEAPYLAALAVAVQVMWMNDWLIKEVGESIVQINDVLLAVLQEGRAPGPQSSESGPLPRPPPAPIVVMDGETVVAELTAEYRTLGEQDRSSQQTLIADVVWWLGKFNKAWELVNEAVELEGTPVHLESIPQVTDIRTPAASAVTAHVVSKPDGVTLSATVTRGRLTLSATTDSTAPEVGYVTVELRYSSPGVATSVTTLDVQVHQQPVRVELVSGGGQTGAPGEQLAQPIVVRVMKGDDPVEGATVRFANALGSVSVIDCALNDPSPKPNRHCVSNPEVVTPANGIVSSSWTLSFSNYSLMDALEPWIPVRVFDADGDPLGEVTVTAVATYPHLSVVSGSVQSGPKNGYFPEPLVFSAHDQYGNPLAGQSIEVSTYNYLGGGSYGGVSSTPTTIVTGADGLANYQWQVNSQCAPGGCASTLCYPGYYAAGRLNVLSTTVNGNRYESANDGLTQIGMSTCF